MLTGGSRSIDIGDHITDQCEPAESGANPVFTIWRLIFQPVAGRRWQTGLVSVPPVPGAKEKWGPSALNATRIVAADGSPRKYREAHRCEPRGSSPWASVVAVSAEKEPYSGADPAGV